MSAPLGAFMMLNIEPGPLLFIERPDVVWGLNAALYVGNVMLLILNIPLIGIFVRILYTPAYPAGDYRRVLGHRNFSQ